MGTTIRQQLFQIALDQYGYVTTDDAQALGIPVVELGKLAYRGRLEPRGRGLYRFAEIPRSERDSFMEAVLWAGAGALLSHDAVLALHDLALVNPTTIRVAVPRRVRRRPRADITLIRQDVPDADRTSYFGIPSTTLARALIDCRPLVMPGRLHDAIEEAHARGLLLRSEHTRVLVSLAGARS